MWAIAILAVLAFIADGVVKGRPHDGHRVAFGCPGVRRDGVRLVAAVSLGFYIHIAFEA